MPTTTDKYFAFAHLPAHLQAISKPFSDLQKLFDAVLPDGPEKSAGMRKLLEAKDCMVRTALDLAPADLLAAVPLTDSDRLAKVLSIAKGGFDSVDEGFAIQVLGFDPEAPEDLTDEQLAKLLDALIYRDRAAKVMHTEDPDHGEA